MSGEKKTDDAISKLGAHLIRFNYIMYLTESERDIELNSVNGRKNVCFV